jgi:S-adenosylmethionine:diacylglycerol 3-amino-3-carboxypropyl transferase
MMNIERQRLAGAQKMRLFFAQVREDPLLEIEALRPAPDEKLVLVNSGGCTALSLLARGAGDVVGVDLNIAQNHVVELKALAISRLGAAEATRFLGGAPGSRRERRATYASLRDGLSVEARAHWDHERAAIGRGVLSCGVTERFMGFIIALVKLFIHGRRRVTKLLQSNSLSNQREFYQREWNNRRWRALFMALLNRWIFNRAYDPAFFQHVKNPSFASHFYKLVEHGLTNIPVATNYFLHYLMTGHYPTDQPGGVPPYLARDKATEDNLRRGKLTLVDGSFYDYLRQAPDKSIDGYALSNICEWLTPTEIDNLFAQIVRTAKPGARVVFRNFVGWTEVPEKWRAQVIEDRPRGEALITADRSLVQRRIAVCSVAG